MSERKRVGVHHECSDIFCFYFFFRKCLQITGKSGTPVFHKNKLSRDPCDFTESESFKKSGRIAFGIKKKMRIASGKLYFDQMTDNGIHQPFPLVFPAYRHTTKRIAKTASGSDEVSGFIVHPTGIIQINIFSYSFFDKKIKKLCIGPLIRRMNIRNKVVRHKNFSEIKIFYEIIL